LQYTFSIVKFQKKILPPGKLRRAARSRLSILFYPSRAVHETLDPASTPIVLDKTVKFGYYIILSAERR